MSVTPVHKKKVVSIGDALDAKTTVAINDEMEVEIRPLSLKEMIELFLKSKDEFLALYAQIDVDAGAEAIMEDSSLHKLLLASPDLIANILATAMDAPDQRDAIRDKMAVGVQLIALQKIWEISVPSPKALADLLLQLMLGLQQNASGLKQKVKTLSQKPSLSVLEQ